MKKRTKRIFISLLTLLVAGMAATHAYIFDVENWQPFGVLNLTKLILKPNTTQTGIILDGENYIIKIDPNNDIPDGGQIRVYEICDENGNNCKKISNLNGEGNGQCYDGISAGGISGEYCYLLQDGNLWCDNSGLPTDSSPYILPVAGNILGGIMLGYPTDTTNKKYAVQIDALNRAYVSVPRAGGNGDTIISGAQILNGTNGYLCTKQGDNLVCDINPNNLGNGGDGAQILEGNENFICTQSGGKNLVCNINPNNLGNGGGITAGGTPGYICRFMEDGNLKCDINPNELGVGNGGGTPIKGEHGKRCKYMCETLIIDGKDPIILDKYSNEEIDTIIAESRESDLSREGCRVECYEDDPNGGGVGGGDGFRWGNLAGINPTIYPTSKNYNVHIGGNAQTSYNLQVDGRSLFSPTNSTEYRNTPEMEVTPAGIRMFGGLNFYRTDYNTQKRVRGLSVNGPILAGRSGNYIYMFANGNSSGDAHRSYEILGENELAVGTRGGAFIYFTQRSGSYDDNEPGSGGGNPGNITRDTTLQDVYSCEEINNSKGTTTVGGTATEGMGIVRGNDLNDPDKCSLNEDVTVNVGHLRHNIDPGLDITDDDAYTSLMVGVNTDSPYATLDVNGSLRVGSNCIPIGLECNATNVGTMMYLERKASYKGSLVICIANGLTPDGTKIKYVWYDIMRGLKGTDLVNDLGFESNDGSCALPKPNGSVYPIPVPANLENEV